MFYDGGSFADQVHSIVSERDPHEHGKMKKSLASAFSDRSLVEQEYLVAGVIDSFVGSLGKSGTREVDLSRSFEMVTFDIISSLAFGHVSLGTFRVAKTC